MNFPEHQIENIQLCVRGRNTLIMLNGYVILANVHGIIPTLVNSQSYLGHSLSTVWPALNSTHMCVPVCYMKL